MNLALLLSKAKFYFERRAHGYWAKFNCSNKIQFKFEPEISLMWDEHYTAMLPSCLGKGKKKNPQVVFKYNFKTITHKVLRCDKL